MTTLFHRGEYDEAVETFRSHRPARPVARPASPVRAEVPAPRGGELVAAEGVEGDVDAPAATLAEPLSGGAAPVAPGDAGEWDDLLADVARTRPAAGDSVDHADGGDLLPTCCLTGILGGVGSLIVFGSAAAIPCLVAAAAGTILGVVVARA